jgi:hypothetical protein
MAALRKIYDAHNHSLDHDHSSLGRWLDPHRGRQDRGPDSLCGPVIADRDLWRLGRALCEPCGRRRSDSARKGLRNDTGADATSDRPAGAGNVAAINGGRRPRHGRGPSGCCYRQG